MIRWFRNLFRRRKADKWTDAQIAEMSARNAPPLKINRIVPSSAAAIHRELLLLEQRRAMEFLTGKPRLYKLQDNDD